jgi:DNA-damage-inducible protein J
MATKVIQVRLDENPGWKAFMDLRKQVQRSAAAGMSEAEIEAEIAAYRSDK